MAMNVSDLGLTPEILRDAVIERAAKMLIDRNSEDYDDEYGWTNSIQAKVDKMLSERMQAAAQAAVDTAIAKHAAPFIDGEIEKIVFQRTNEWGEKQGEPKSFREFLIDRIHAYIVEPVGYDGKTNAQDSYNWRQHSTRIAFMVDKHLHYEVETAMKAAFTDLNSKVAGGLLEAVRVSLNSALAGLKASVSTK